MEVRKATPQDIPYILDMYKKGLNELGFTDWKESLLVKKVTESFILAPCFIMVKNDIVIGMAGLTIVITSHNGVATLADYMFYVEPEHRNITNLGGLTDKIKSFSDETGMPVKLEFLALNNDEKLKSRVLNMHGFDVFSVTGVYDG